MCAVVARVPPGWRDAGLGLRANTCEPRHRQACAVLWCLAMLVVATGAPATRSRLQAVLRATCARGPVLAHLTRPTPLCCFSPRTFFCHPRHHPCRAALVTPVMSTPVGGVCAPSSQLSLHQLEIERIEVVGTLCRKLKILCVPPCRAAPGPHPTLPYTGNALPEGACAAARGRNQAEGISFACACVVPRLTIPIAVPPRPWRGLVAGYRFEFETVPCMCAMCYVCPICLLCLRRRAGRALQLPAEQHHRQARGAGPHEGPAVPQHGPQQRHAHTRPGVRASHHAVSPRLSRPACRAPPVASRRVASRGAPPPPVFGVPFLSFLYFLS